MKIVVAVPIWGATVLDRGLEPVIKAAESAGADGFWIGDHLVLSKRDLDGYPYESFFLSPTDVWLEAVVTLTYVATLATRGEIGLGIALAAVRPPVELARQTATLSQLLSPEQHLAMGVGTGWMRAEYEAMGVDWKARGRVLDSSIDLIRACWTGEPEPGLYGQFTISPDTYTYPVPKRPIPIIVAGDAKPALRRAVQRGDGWLGPLGPWEWADPKAEASLVRSAVSAIRQMCDDAGRDVTDMELSVSVGVPRDIVQSSDGCAKFTRLVEHLESQGIRRVVLTLGWRDVEETRNFLATCLTAVRENMRSAQ